MSLETLLLVFTLSCYGRAPVKSCLNFLSVLLLISTDWGGQEYWSVTMGALLEFCLKQSPEWGNRETIAESRSETILFPKIAEKLRFIDFKSEKYKWKQAGMCFNLFGLLYQIIIDHVFYKQQKILAPCSGGEVQVSIGGFWWGPSFGFMLLRSTQAFFMRAWFPFMSTPLSGLKNIPNSPPPNNINFVVGIPIYGLWEHKHSDHHIEI